MDIKVFIDNIIDQFDEAPSSGLVAESVLRDIDGWSSIVALSIMAMIDEEYDVQIKAEEMRNSKTVQDLFDTVQKYL